MLFFIRVIYENAKSCWTIWNDMIYYFVLDFFRGTYFTEKQILIYPHKFMFSWNKELCYNNNQKNTTTKKTCTVLFSKFKLYSGMSWLFVQSNNIQFSPASYTFLVFFLTDPYYLRNFFFALLCIVCNVAMMTNWPNMLFHSLFGFFLIARIQ